MSVFIHRRERERLDKTWLTDEKIEDDVFSIEKSLATFKQGCQLFSLVMIEMRETLSSTFRPLVKRCYEVNSEIWGWNKQITHFNVGFDELNPERKREREGKIKWTKEMTDKRKFEIFRQARVYNAFTTISIFIQFLQLPLSILTFFSLFW